MPGNFAKQNCLGDLAFFVAVFLLVIGVIVLEIEKQVNTSHCLKINLAEKGVCLKTKNLAQIKIVPTGNGGTNGVRHENQKKNLRGNIQTLPKSDKEKQRQNIKRVLSDA
jgi:hypothetical protein